MRNGILTALRKKRRALPAGQRAIADYISSNPKEASFLSLEELAARCDAAEEEVLRLVRKLGVESFERFRDGVARETAAKGSVQSVYGEIGREDSTESLMAKVISFTARSVAGLRERVRPDDIGKAVRRIANAERMFFFGLGASSCIAFDAYHKFLRLGMHAEATSDTHLMNMMATHATAKDLVFAVSHSGESRDILDCLKLAADNGATVIALTGTPGSEITRLADIVFLSSSGTDRLRSDELVSRVLQIVIVDLLYVAMVREMGPEAVERIERSRRAVAGKKR